MLIFVDFYFLQYSNASLLIPQMTAFVSLKQSPLTTHTSRHVIALFLRYKITFILNYLLKRWAKFAHLFLYFKKSSILPSSTFLACLTHFVPLHVTTTVAPSMPTTIPNISFFIVPSHISVCNTPPNTQPNCGNPCKNSIRLAISTAESFLS